MALLPQLMVVGAEEAELDTDGQLQRIPLDVERGVLQPQDLVGASAVPIVVVAFNDVAPR